MVVCEGSSEKKTCLQQLTQASRGSIGPRLRYGTYLAAPVALQYRTTPYYGDLPSLQSVHSSAEHCCICTPESTAGQ